MGESRSVSEWRKVRLGQIKHEEESEAENKTEKKEENKLQNREIITREMNWQRQNRIAGTKWDTAFLRRLPDKESGDQCPVCSEAKESKQCLFCPPKPKALWHFQQPTVLRSADF